MSSLSKDFPLQASDGRNVAGEQIPDPQVIPGNSEFGNRYPRAFKIKILKEADECTQPGQIGRLLKSAGISHTTLTSFRKQRAAGTLDTNQANRTLPAEAANHNTGRVLQLEREIRKLRRRLEQAEAIIDVQKKVSRLLEISLQSEDESSK